MAERRAEGGGHHALDGTVTDKAGIAAGAQRQAEGVEQNRLAGAGLACQDGQAAFERDIEPLDEHDVANRQCVDHGPL